MLGMRNIKKTDDGYTVTITVDSGIVNDKRVIYTNTLSEAKVVRDNLYMISSKTNTGCKFVNLNIAKGKIYLVVKITNKYGRIPYSLKLELSDMDDIANVLKIAADFIKSSVNISNSSNLRSNILKGYNYLYRNLKDLPRFIYQTTDIHNRISFKVAYSRRYLDISMYTNIDKIGIYTGDDLYIEFDLLEMSNGKRIN